MIPNDMELMARLSEVFTPTRPISLPNLLAGRLDLLLRLLGDARAASQHVLLYGDRGVGKTSIAHVLEVLVHSDEEYRPMTPIFVSCDTNDTFKSMWQKAFQEVPVYQSPLGLTPETEATVIGRLDQESSLKSPTDVRRLVDRFEVPVVVIFDEYDRVQDLDARRLMTDAIKLFSDNDTDCTVVLVGVGQSIEELVTAHQSISRNLDFVHVGLMDPQELAGIIEKGFGKVGFRYEVGLDSRIAQLSQGYPHYTHLLGLRAGLSAANRDSDEVIYTDLTQAIRDSLERVDGSIKLEYQDATNSTQPNNLYKQVLLACAMAEKDMMGGFGLSSVREPLQQLLKRDIKPVSYQRHLATFCEPDHGPTLIKTGRPKNYRWRFRNPQLIPFVHLQGVNDGLLDSGLAERLGNPTDAGQGLLL